MKKSIQKRSGSHKYGKYPLRMEDTSTVPGTQQMPSESKFLFSFSFTDFHPSDPKL